VSKADDKIKRKAMILWGIQLVFNFFWSIIFFGNEQIFGAFLEIIGLWLFILLTIFAFARIDKRAAWLLVPYISWVSFAAYLNFTIWELNR
jgi:tryptophan-rich sensory protein